MTDEHQSPKPTSPDTERELAHIAATARNEAAPPRRFGAMLFGICVALLLAGGLTFGLHQSVAQKKETLSSAERLTTFVPEVRVATVKGGPTINTVTLPASTAAFVTTNIFARASGYIDQRNVDIGDRVKEGQILAHITAPELDHQIAQAEAVLAQLRATVQQVQANRDLAQATWQRDSPLVKQGWATAQQGDTDRLTLRAQDAARSVAEANVTAQEAQLQVLRQQKEYQTIVAPFDGTITQRRVNVGDLVQADATSGTFLFTLMQSDVIRAQVFVPQNEATGLAVGVDAAFRVPEMPGRVFNGKVARIADALQPDTRTLLTEIDIQNHDGALAPGLYGTVELHIPSRTQSVRIPAEAIIFDRGGLQVAVVENGVARIRKVSVSRDFGTELEIGDGVKAGDQIILSPPVDLIDGRRVRVRQDASAAPGMTNSADPAQPR